MQDRPLIQEDIIPYLHQMSNKHKVPMTRVVDNVMRLGKTDAMTTDELKFLLSGRKILLDCGHVATIGHNFANTVIIVSLGGGKIKTMCHECGY
jgi:hypothetical protein